MAWEVPGRTITLPASADLSGYQFCFVTVDASGQVALPSTGAAVMGVLQNKPTAANEAATIMIDGVSKILIGGTTEAAGDVITTNSSGRAVAPGTGDYTIGRLLGGSSGTADRVGTVQVQPVGTT